MLALADETFGHGDHLFPLGPGIGSLEAQHGDRRHDGALPPQQTQGASLEPVRPRDIRVESTDLILKLVDALADREPDACFRLRLCEPQFKQCRYRGHNALPRWQSFLESVDDDFAGMLGLEPSVLRKAVETLQRVEAWDFLEAPALGHSGPDDELAHFDRWSSSLLREEQPWHPNIPAPRPIGKDRIILHAFAGRRRVGRLSVVH